MAVSDSPRLRETRIERIAREVRSLGALAAAVRQQTLRYFSTLTRVERSIVLRRYLSRRRKALSILRSRGRSGGAGPHLDWRTARQRRPFRPETHPI